MDEQKRYFDETYDILEEIGSGSGGTVYSAYHKRLKKLVVLKKISERAAKRLDTRAEADTLKNLKHPYLPQVLDFLEREDGIYTVMDFISGQTFEQCMQEGKGFTQNQIVKYARQLCEALSYLHHQKVPIIHSDIKPSNIMLTLEDNICLIDFNVSAYLKEEKGTVAGCTKGYAAPEQYLALIGKKRVSTERTLFYSEKTEYIGEEEKAVWQEEEAFAGLDERSDIYSLGATLYHLVTGKMPSGDVNEQLAVSENECRISEALAAIINKAVQIKPDARFQSADEMLSALKQIAKTDKRYQSLLHRQKLCNIFCLLFFAGSILMVVLGVRLLREEKRQQYAELVAALEKTQEEEHFWENYQKCLELFPEEMDAYLARAAFLYRKGSYEDCAAFLSDTLNSHSFSETPKKGQLYYLLAGCLAELQRMEEAVMQYEKALACDASNADYYRDYAVALVGAGKIEEAKTCLEEAQEKGSGADSLYLVRGEIEAALGNREAAREQFRQCIGQTKDDYLKFRSYVMLGKTYDFEKNDETALLEKLSILSAAREELPSENQALIFEQIVQTYIDLNTMTEKEAYLQDALGVLDQIVANGWGSYNTHNNIALIKEQLNDYDGSEEELQKMLAEYGEAYDVYKRLALLEIQKQNKKALSERDYHLFAEYYEKSEELFAQSGKEKDSDMEMAVLEQAYRQVDAGNWLRE